MPYTLYGRPRSGSCAVECALAEIEAEFELSIVELNGEQRASPYRALNPVGKLPALVTPDGEVLTQSAAILLTLGHRHPESGLLPAPRSKARARAVEWLTFVAAEIYSLIEICDYPDRFSATPGNADAIEKAAIGLLRERWLMVEEAAVGGPWFLDVGFSAVDPYVATVSRWSVGNEWRERHCPKVEGIVRALNERPRVADVWRRHFPEGRDLRSSD